MEPLQHQHVHRHRVRRQAHQQVRLVLLESQGPQGSGDLLPLQRPPKHHTGRGLQLNTYQLFLSIFNMNSV